MDIFAAKKGGRLDHRKTFRCIKLMNFSPRPQFCETEAFLSIPNHWPWVGNVWNTFFFECTLLYRFCRYAIFSEGGFWYTGFHRGIDSLPFKESFESVICQHWNHGLVKPIKASSPSTYEDLVNISFSPLLGGSSQDLEVVRITPICKPWSSAIWKGNNPRSCGLTIAIVIQPRTRWDDPPSIAHKHHHQTVLTYSDWLPTILMKKPPAPRLVG